MNLNVRRLQDMYFGAFLRGIKISLVRQFFCKLVIFLDSCDYSVSVPLRPENIAFRHIPNGKVR